MLAAALCVTVRACYCWSEAPSLFAAGQVQSGTPIMSIGAYINEVMLYHKVWLVYLQNILAFAIPGVTHVQVYVQFSVNKGKHFVLSDLGF